MKLTIIVHNVFDVRSLYKMSACDLRQEVRGHVRCLPGPRSVSRGFYGTRRGGPTFKRVMRVESLNGLTTTGGSSRCRNVQFSSTASLIAISSPFRRTIPRRCYPLALHVTCSGREGRNSAANCCPSALFIVRTTLMLPSSHANAHCRNTTVLNNG